MTKFSLSLFLVVFLFTACSTPSVKEEATIDSVEQTQEQIVEKRFYERWQAIIDKDYEKVYSFLSPATREIVPLEQYKAMLNRPYRKVALQKVDCDGDVCKVVFSLVYDHSQMSGIETLMGEKWFFLDGQAWFNLPESDRTL